MPSDRQKKTRIAAGYSSKLESVAFFLLIGSVLVPDRGKHLLAGLTLGFFADGVSFFLGELRFLLHGVDDEIDAIDDEDEEKRKDDGTEEEDRVVLKAPDEFAVVDDVRIGVFADCGHHLDGDDKTKDDDGQLKQGDDSEDDFFVF